LRPPPLLAAATLALVALGGCGGGKSEREAELERKLAASEARAQHAEGELAKAQKLLAGQQAGSDAGFDDDDSGEGTDDGSADDLADPPAETSE
jgi:hypothetical protein